MLENNLEKICKQEDLLNQLKEQYNKVKEDIKVRFEDKVQKIQQGKLVARSEKRPLKDGDVSTACSTACSTNAITFGDVNDKDSKIRKKLKVEKIDKATLKLKEERAYAVLDEIRVSPNVWYLRKVRNKKNV